jgi:putative FmdB family regulatory protein
MDDFRTILESVSPGLISTATATSKKMTCGPSDCRELKMPIYEYQCKACGHRLEKLQKINATPLSDCPSCEKPELSRLISAAGFRLAGGGWYETDFKSGSKKNLAGDNSDKRGKTPAAAESKTPSGSSSTDKTTA